MIVIKKKFQTKIHMILILKKFIFLFIEIRLVLVFVLLYQ